MGRHSKRTRGVSRFAAIVGAAVAMPFTQGAALAHPTINWGPIEQCESGGNPRAHNPSSSASGLFQIVRGTWATFGGLAFGRSAADASPAEQEMIANRIYARDGLSDWAASQSCWGRQASAVYQYSSSARVRRIVVRRSPGEMHYPRESYYPRSFHRRYRVRRGDTLSGIAFEHGYSWEQVYALNRLEIHNPNLIEIGATITL